MVSIKSLFVSAAMVSAAMATVFVGESAPTLTCSNGAVAVDLLGICVCAEIGTIGQSNSCPDCTSPYASTSVCTGIHVNVFSVVKAGVGACACQCDSDAYAAYIDGKSGCYPTEGCSGELGSVEVTDKIYGYSTCTCADGYVFSKDAGGCVATVAKRLSKRRLAASN